MADIAKINLDGTTYTLKDAAARTAAQQAQTTATSAASSASAANASAAQAATNAAQAQTDAKSALSASGTNTAAIATINGKKFAKASYTGETLTLTNTLIGG